MPNYTKTTSSAKPAEMEKSRAWFVVDATNQSIGRLAVEAAKILHGKHKPQWTPHVDCGDHVIIVNTDKVRLTGSSKRDEPIYRHTLYPGGLRSITRGRELERDSVGAMKRTVKGMLPHNTLGAQNLCRLHVYAGPEHPHQAQTLAPASLTVDQKLKKAQEATMPPFEFVIEQEKEFGCLQLAVTQRSQKKYLGGTIFSDHYALWWTAHAGLEEFWSEVLRLTDRMREQPKQRSESPKAFHGLYLYTDGSNEPIHITSDVKCLPEQLSSTDMSRYADGHNVQMLRLADDWGDITYDLKHFTDLPRRISFASHRRTVEGLDRLIWKTNAGVSTQPDVQKVIGRLMQEFDANMGNRQVKSGKSVLDQSQHNGRGTPSITYVGGKERNVRR